MRQREEVENWAVYRAQQIVMREGMNLALSARESDSTDVRAKGKLLAMAIAASLVEAYAVAAE